MVGPQMRPVERVDKLRGNPHSAPGFAYRAFEDVADAELAPDLLHVNCLAFIGEARIAGDDEKPADTRQGGDDLLDHAVGEIFLLRIAGHVLEWQYRQRRLIGQRRRVALLKCRGIGARLCRDPRHRRGKAIAAPSHRLDTAPLRSPLIKDPAKRRDLHVFVNTKNKLITDVIAGLLDGPAWLRRVLIERVIATGHRLDELIRDHEALEDFIRKTAIGVRHATCTCRMGAEDDPMAVTDGQGRVRGVGGLRVVDASLFPVVPRADTNFPTLMTAEKIADAMLAAA